MFSYNTNYLNILNIASPSYTFEFGELEAS